MANFYYQFSNFELNNMDCIIIEDEKKTAKRLEEQLTSLRQDIQVKARIDSVKDAVLWLEQNQTDLIFLDIQLGDGLGFEIFDHIQIKTPVIFTTSYDEYMARAFEVNSISYLLKPVILDDLKAALNKYYFLNKSSDNINEKIIPLNPHVQQRFLVRDGNSLKPILLDEVAYFYVENKHYLFLVTKNGQQYLYDSTLKILEQRLDPKQFFRISKQFIVAFDVIKKISVFDDSRRVMIETERTFKDPLIVSRYVVTEFKKWLSR